MDNFRDLEVRTVADMDLIARWRARTAPPSGWLIEAPPSSETAEEFTGQLAPSPNPLPDDEKERLHELGRRLDARLAGLRGRPGVGTLEWLVAAGGTALARRQGSIPLAVGRALSSKGQRAVWALDGELADRMTELWGQGLWEQAVKLWNGACTGSPPMLTSVK